MAARKLTLSVDEQVIERARRYSQLHNTSISRLVSTFLAQLPVEPDEETPIVRRLRGILPVEADVREHKGYLDEKYGG
ncbi:MAG: DUF6364 family protein [Gemmatimonadota bacterium]